MKLRMLGFWVEIASNSNYGMCMDGSLHFAVQNFLPLYLNCAWRGFDECFVLTEGDSPDDARSSSRSAGLAFGPHGRDRESQPMDWSQKHWAF